MWKVNSHVLAASFLYNLSLVGIFPFLTHITFALFSTRRSSNGLFSLFGNAGRTSTNRNLLCDHILKIVCLLYKYGGRKFTRPPGSGNWLFRGHSLSVATKLRVSVKALHLRSMLWSGSSEDGSLFGICRTRGLNWGNSWFNMIFQVI